jgi:AcrR family transcriptional regulator
MTEGAQPVSANTARPARGRPPRVTRDEVLARALTLPHNELTMTGLARELGVSASVVHYHFATRDELVDAVVEQLLDALSLPVLGDDKQQWLRETGWFFYRLALKYPVLVQGHPLPGARALNRKFLGQLLTNVRHWSGSVLDARDALQLVVDVAYSHARRDSQIDAHEHGRTRMAVFEDVSPEDLDFAVELAKQAPAPGSSASFERALEVTIAGIVQVLGA